MFDIEKDIITYKDHVIENFFKDFPQQPYIKDYVKTNLIKGMFLTLKNYDIKLTKEVFDIFYDVLKVKLSLLEMLFVLIILI